MIIIIIAFDILVSVYTKRNCRNDVGNGLITIFGPLQSSLYDFMEPQRQRCYRTSYHVDET